MQFEGEGNQAMNKFQYTSVIERLHSIKKSLDDEVRLAIHNLKDRGTMCIALLYIATLSI
jgi:hypothetical protein